MKYKFITASLLLALSTTAAADRPRSDRIIDRLDSNGDDKISIEEFRAPRGGDRMMMHADTDGDGVVTVAELAARHQERAAKAQEKLDERNERFADHIAALDQDNNGIITSEEARQAAFARMDENGDGFISADEFRAPRGMGKGPGHRRGDRFDGERRRDH